ncbi:MAG TPA: hypothetical protein VNO81_00190 [Candidatus Nitrosotenuis sp.]|jgi:hypothetical protein|nr:hypothetical protein [Candidatus Nitrosotenuis sp.]
MRSKSIAGLVAALLLLAACAGPEPARPDLPIDFTARPWGAADGFRQLVLGGHYDSAYDLLSAGLKKKYSRALFEMEYRRMLETSLGRQEFERRRVESERLDDETGWVMLRNPEQPASPPWIWRFVREGGQWKLSEVESPPVILKADG